MDVICEIAEDLAAGRTDRLDRLFTDDDAPPPRLLPDPAPDALPIPLPRLLDHWTSLCAGDALPAPRAVDPADLRFILGNLMLVDVGPPGPSGVPAFVYRLYGTRIAACYGHDMTGRTTADFASRLAVFFAATYEAVRRSRRPLYTEHTPHPPSGITRWQRLILPLAGPDGAVCRFLVGNQAVTSIPCGPLMPQRAGRREPGG